MESPGKTILFILTDLKLYLFVLSGLYWLLTGSVASSVVAGTIFLSWNRDIVLFEKF